MNNPEQSASAFFRSATHTGGRAAMLRQLEQGNVPVEKDDLPQGKTGAIQGDKITLSRDLEENSPLYAYTLAHEMAHAVQQGNSGPVATEAEAEKEASAAAMAWLTGNRMGFLDLLRSRVSRTARLYQSCGAQPKQELPSFMGQASREAVQEIDWIIGSTNALNVIIPIGLVLNSAEPVESAATGGPGDTFEAAARAVKGIPAIRDARILQVIQFLLLEHGNNMNAEERAFWNRAMYNLSLIRSRQ